MNELVNLAKYLEENFGSGFDIKEKSITYNLPQTEKWYHPMT